MNNNHIRNQIILAIFFTGVLMFLIYEIPTLLNNLLSQYFPDIHPVINPDEIEAFINLVRPIGYVCLGILVILIILGFLIKKEKISVSSSFLLFLPTFGFFAYSMFFLAGIGILQVIWVPLDTPFFNFLLLGNIVFFPVYFLESAVFFRSVSFVSLAFSQFVINFPWIVMTLGLFIFILGVISWLNGKFQRKKIIKSSIYKYSRHPQYLGILIWSYGSIIHYMNSELLITPMGKIGLIASLPWVVFALILIGVAFLEDIKLSKEFPEEYKEYQRKTPFLIKLPKSLRSIIAYPMLFIIKKNFPETKKDVLKVIVFYGVIIIILSLLSILIMFPGLFS